MQTSLTFTNAAALFGSMVVLALVPSISVLVVSSRAASSGFIHGAFATLGIVIGDLLYILLAIFGLALLTEAMGNLAFLIKYAGGAYLIWLGINLWRSSARDIGGNGAAIASSRLSSFMSGLLLTLADQKVIFFYLGFLPAFLDISNMTLQDAAIICLLAIVAVSGVKLGYAYMADRAGALIGAKAGRGMSKTAGTIMIAAGIYLAAKP